MNYIISEKSDPEIGRVNEPLAPGNSFGAKIGRNRFPGFLRQLGDDRIDGHFFRPGRLRLFSHFVLESNGVPSLSTWRHQGSLTEGKAQYN